MENKTNAKIPKYRVVLLGASGVGKTSILVRATLNIFYHYQESTIGAAYNSKEFVDPSSGRVVNLNIWDTAGQERYRSLAPMYYRAAHVALVVYDITSPESLDRAKYWVEELKRSSPLDALQIVLVANKIDLEEKRRVEAPLEFCKDEKCQHFETSAKTGEGVIEMFQTFAANLPPLKELEGEEDSDEQSEDTQKINFDAPRTQQRKNCCG